MVREHRIPRTGSNAAVLTATTGATHLHVHTVRQGASRVAAPRAAVVPAHAEVTLRPTTHLEPEVSERLSLVHRREPAAPRVDADRVPGDAGHRTRAVAPVDSGRDVWLALQILRELDDVVRMTDTSTTTIGIPRQFRERARIDLRQLPVVLLRVLPVDDPLASIQPSRRHIVLVEREEPVTLIRARARLRQPVATMMTTLSVGRAGPQTTCPLPRSGSLVPVARVFGGEGDRHILAVDRIHRLLRLTSTILHRPRIQLRLRLRLLLIQILDLALTVSRPLVEITLLQRRHRSRLLRTKVERERQGHLLIRPQLVDVHERVRRRRLSIQQTHRLQSLNVLRIQRGDVHVRQRRRTLHVQRRQLQTRVLRRDLQTRIIQIRRGGRVRHVDLREPVLHPPVELVLRRLVLDLQIRGTGLGVVVLDVPVRRLELLLRLLVIDADLHVIRSTALQVLHLLADSDQVHPGRLAVGLHLDVQLVREEVHLVHQLLNVLAGPSGSLTDRIQGLRALREHLRRRRTGRSRLTHRIRDPVEAVGHRHTGRCRLVNRTRRQALRTSERFSVASSATQSLGHALHSVRQFSLRLTLRPLHTIQLVHGLHELRDLRRRIIRRRADLLDRVLRRRRSRPQLIRRGLGPHLSITQRVETLRSEFATIAHVHELLTHRVIPGLGPVDDLRELLLTHPQVIDGLLGFLSLTIALDGIPCLVGVDHEVFPHARRDVHRPGKDRKLVHEAVGGIRLLLHRIGQRLHLVDHLRRSVTTRREHVEHRLIRVLRQASDRLASLHDRIQALLTSRIQGHTSSTRSHRSTPRATQHVNDTSTSSLEPRHRRGAEALHSASKRGHRSDSRVPHRPGDPVSCVHDALAGHCELLRSIRRELLLHRETLEASRCLHIRRRHSLRSLRGRATHRTHRSIHRGQLHAHVRGDALLHLHRRAERSHTRRRRLSPGSDRRQCDSHPLGRLLHTIQSLRRTSHPGNSAGDLRHERRDRLEPGPRGHRGGNHRRMIRHDVRHRLQRTRQSLSHRPGSAQNPDEQIPRRHTQRGRCLRQRSAHLGGDRGQGLTRRNELLHSLTSVRKHAHGRIRRHDLTQGTHGVGRELLHRRDTLARHPRRELIHDRLSPIIHLVQSISDTRETTSSLGEERSGDRRTKTPGRRTHVLQRALDRVTGLECRTAHATLHGVGERLEVDLALGDHVRDLPGRFPGLVGEELQHRDAPGQELQHVVALQLAAGGDTREDRAHVRHRRAGDRRRVADGGEDLLEFLPRLDAGSDKPRGGSSRLLETEASAFHRGERVLHDGADLRRRVAETLELRLSLLNAVQAADALGESGSNRGTTSSTCSETTLLEGSASRARELGAE